jgi:hypothetical protein
MLAMSSYQIVCANVLKLKDQCQVMFKKKKSKLLKKSGICFPENFFTQVLIYNKYL